MFGLIIFPAPSWGLSGAGDYLYVRTDRFSGAVLGTFRRPPLSFCLFISVCLVMPPLQCFNQINYKQVFNHLRIKE